MNILAEFKKLKETVAGFLADQSKATLASITEFSTKLTALETGAVAQVASQELTIGQHVATIADLTAKNSDNNREIFDLQGQMKAATDSLRAHMAKVDVAYAPNGPKANVTLADLVTAEINATNSALAKTGVDVTKLPAAPAASGPASTAPVKFKTADEEIAWRKSQAKA